MPNPEDLITVIQAAAFRTESGSPLSENAIRDAVAAGKLNRYSLPVTGAKLLVSRAEVEAYQSVGHKPKGYKHEKTIRGKAIMNITNIELTDAQWERLQLLAVQEATRRGHPKPAGDETPQNVLRLALGFETRKQGGYRPRKAPKGEPNA